MEAMVTHNIHGDFLVVLAMELCPYFGSNIQPFEKKWMTMQNTRFWLLTMIFLFKLHTSIGKSPTWWAQSIHHDHDPYQFLSKSDKKCTCNEWLLPKVLCFSVFGKKYFTDWKDYLADMECFFCINKKISLWQNQLSRDWFFYFFHFCIFYAKIIFSVSMVKWVFWKEYLKTS